jgi:hypothetical protein
VALVIDAAREIFMPTDTAIAEPSFDALELASKLAREHLLKKSEGPFKDSAIFTHRCRIDTGGVAAGDFKLKIFDRKGDDGFGVELAKFRGTSGGATLGGLAGAGTIECWIPPQAISNWEATFAVEAGGLGFAFAFAELWSMDHRLIGVAVVSGGGVGVNVAGGKGQFGQAQPCYITVADSPKVVDLDDGSSENGAKIQIWDYHGGDNQQWRLEEVEPGYFYIASVRTGKAITVKGGSSEPGSPLVQWERNGGDNQKWKILAAGDKSKRFAFASKSHPQMLIDLTGGVTDNGTPLQQWTNLGYWNQSWSLQSFVR